MNSNINQGIPFGPEGKKWVKDVIVIVIIVIIIKAVTYNCSILSYNLWSTVYSPFNTY